MYRVAGGSQVDVWQVLLAKILAVGGAACEASAAAGDWTCSISVDAHDHPVAHLSVRPRGSRVTDSLPESDIARVDGMPATRPARTMIELAADHAVGPVRGRARQGDRREAGHNGATREAGPRASCAEPPWLRVVLLALAERHPELGRAPTRWKRRVLRVLDRLGAPRPSGEPTRHPARRAAHRRLRVGGAEDRARARRIRPALHADGSSTTTASVATSSPRKAGTCTT